MVQGQSTDQLNPVKTQVSDHHGEQVSHQGLLCPGGTNLWSDSLQGTATTQVTNLTSSGWREDNAAPSTHSELAAVNHLAPFPSPAFQRSRRKAQAQRTNPHFYNCESFMVWKKSFSTCCPRNRRSSMSLKVSTGLLTADHRPRAELRIWGERVWQDKAPCGEGSEETFRTNGGRSPRLCQGYLEKI